MRGRACNAQFTVTERKVDLREYRLGIPLGRLAERYGIRVAAPALHLNSAIGFRDNAKRGSLGLRDTAFLGLHHGFAITESHAQVGAGTGQLVIGRRNRKGTLARTEDAR